MFLVCPVDILKTFKTKGKSTSRERIWPLRAIPGARGGRPFQGTTSQQGSGPPLAAQVWVQRSAPSTHTVLEERNVRNTLGNQRKIPCAPSLSQAPLRFPAIGNGTPHRRCIAMPGAPTSSPEPYLGSHSSHCWIMHRKW